MFLSRKYFTESKYTFFKSWCSHVWLWVSSGEGRQQESLLSVTREQHRSRMLPWQWGCVWISPRCSGEQMQDQSIPCVCAFPKPSSAASPELS